MEETTSQSKQNDSTSNGDKDLVEEFAGYTTLHGLHFVITRESSVRRIIWTLLLLGGASFMAIQLYTSFIKLRENSYRVVKELERSESITFPAFTVCNNNMMKKSQILGTDAQYYLDQLDSSKRLMDDKNISDSFNIEEAVWRYGHNISEMLKVCSWKGETCTAENFTTFVSYNFGLCHTFNSGRDGQPLLETSRAGKQGGLNLIISIQPDEYYGPMSYLASGLVFMVHDQTVWPLIETFGMDAMPGFTTNVRIKRKKIISLNPPYKSACGERKLKTFKSYSLGACFVDCYTRITIKRCGCRPVATPDMGNATKYCLPKDMRNCQEKKGESSGPSNSTKGQPMGSNFLHLNPTMCDCPIPCQKVEHKTTLNTAYFPSESFVKPMLKLINGNRNFTIEDIDFLKTQLRKQVAAINVFYEDLSTDVTKEIPSYGINEFGSEVGGNLGLFLGCSLLTLCEFIDLFIVMCLNRRRRARQERTGTETQGLDIATTNGLAKEDNTDPNPVNLDYETKDETQF